MQGCSATTGRSSKAGQPSCRIGQRRAVHGREADSARREGADAVGLQRFIHDPAGIDAGKLAWVKDLRIIAAAVSRNMPRSSASVLPERTAVGRALRSRVSLRHANGRRARCAGAGEERLQGRRRGREHADQPSGHPGVPRGEVLHAEQGGERGRRRRLGPGDDPNSMRLQWCARNSTSVCRAS